MKKFLFILFTIFTFACCTNDEYNIQGEEIIKYGPQTEVYVKGYESELQNRTIKKVNYKDEEGYTIPIDGQFEVFYYIRIDSNIPGECDSSCRSGQYFPQTSTGKTIFDDLNCGFIKAEADWKTNFKFSKYLYDPTGVKIQNIITKEPTLNDLIACNKSKDNFNGYLEHADELHFLWYSCKKQDSDHCWHIDGILTSKDKGNISETIYGDEIANKYNDVEVDIHQQEHKDWGEIKTSVHLRSVTDVEITLPIESDYVQPTDDFAIRTYDYQNIVVINNSTSFENLKVIVKHEDGKTIMNITGLTEDMLKLNNGEITVEVHSYYKSISEEELWNKLKKSYVKVTTQTVGICGQIHYKDDAPDKWIKITYKK